MNTKSLDSEKITQMFQLPPTNKSGFIYTVDLFFLFFCFFYRY